MKTVDFVLVLLILLAVSLALRTIFRKKKNGGCGCGCSGCAFSESCSDTPDNSCRTKRDTH